MAEIGSRRPPEWFRSNQSSSTGSSCSHRGMDVSRDCGGEDAVLTRVAVLIVGGGGAGLTASMILSTLGVDSLRQRPGKWWTSDLAWFTRCDQRVMLNAR